MNETGPESKEHEIQIDQARNLVIGNDTLYVHIEHLHVVLTAEEFVLTWPTKDLSPGDYTITAEIGP